MDTFRLNLPMESTGVCLLYSDQGKDLTSTKSRTKDMDFTPLNMNLVQSLIQIRFTSIRFTSQMWQSYSVICKQDTTSALSLKTLLYCQITSK